MSPRALRLHVTVIVLLVSFGLLARWQIARAVGGNGLSWAYAFEWPLFAIYAVYIWWRILHDHAPAKHPRRRSSRSMARDAHAEAELTEYNAYLAALHREDDESERRNV